jgi:formylglycine-generating enzyme required for sulfatase activity
MILEYDTGLHQRRAELPPRERIEWRRVGIGYGTTGCLVLLGLVLMTGNSTRRPTMWGQEQAGTGLSTSVQKLIAAEEALSVRAPSAVSAVEEKPTNSHGTVSLGGLVQAQDNGGPTTVDKDNKPIGAYRTATNDSVISTVPDFLVSPVGQIKLQLIPAGEFLMGSSKDEDKDALKDELPKHRVRITRPFYLGVTEVTQGQYRAVTGQSPSNFKGSDDLPVERVSWDDARNFCNALSRAEGIPLFYRGDGAENIPLFFYRDDGGNLKKPEWNGPGYRLPTEAEWEYACRAKNPARYSFGDDPAALGEHAWFAGNSGNQTHPVGQKRPNAFGLFDMQGNVWEWCSDGYGLSARSLGDDPVGPLGAWVRVVRGGGWNGNPRNARSASRLRGTPDDRYYDLGFRLARGQSGR